MKKVTIILTLCLLSALLALEASAGEYSSDFDLYSAGFQPDDNIGAIITMADQVDLEALQAGLLAERAARREWHEAVVLALQEKATVTQAEILAQLLDLKARGLVENYQNMWLGNVVLVKAPIKTLNLLVQRDDVLMINPDYEIENIAPVGKGGDEPIIAGVENGLRAINADLVWDMGITGEGRLVSHLDTGVDGNHPALADRWRGLDPRYSANPEWAWFDPVTNTIFPFAAGAHGTHTMGTICGLGETTGDTIGVAFGAEWMSAGVIDRVSIPQTVADALLSFQWIVDPDGDPSTVWDVPDVCSNSWGVTTGHGYPPCEQTFWTVLDGCEAAGIVVLFAAGNEGFSGLRRPADRATTDITSFAVGALNGNDPNFPIAGFSSRGPTFCTPDGSAAIKPEVSAPGVNVRSSVPGGGYQSSGWSGTSMACPHVAGVVALMRQANPNLTSAQVREILLDTAVDLGTQGNDNDYGMGIIDAYQAVLMAQAFLDGWGTFIGTITDMATSQPIDGAVISVLNRPWAATSRVDGTYTLFVPADTLWDLRIDNSPTHLPVFDQQMAIENDTLVLNYALEGKVTVTLTASFNNPDDVSYRSFYLKGSWDNDGFYDASWSGDLFAINDDGVAPDQTADDGIFTGSVMLAKDTVNTYSWAIYSENYGGEDSNLDDGANFQILDLNPPTVPTLAVNPSGSENNWVITAEGDHGLSLDLTQGIDNSENKWGAAIALIQDTLYTFRFTVMHSTAASYGSGGIGGPDLTFTPDVDGSYDFIFNDMDDSYIVQLTGTEGPPTYVSAQSGLDGHIPVGWLPPGTVESQEMAYDDGTLANAYYYFAYDALMATMFIPLSHPVTIDSVRIHVLTEGDEYWPWPDPVHDPVGVSIFLDNGSGSPENTPVFYTETVCTPGEWIKVDVDEILVSSGNFWVALNNIEGGGEDGMGLDANTDFPANKWSFTNGVWGLESQYNGDHMIRAKVFGGTSLAWMGHDSSPAEEVSSSIPININSDLSAGSSSPIEIKSAVQTHINIDRLAFHPRLSATHPPVGSDIEVLAGYNLYRDVSPSPFDRNMQINSGLISETNYDDWGVDQYGPIVNGTTYYYQGSAVYDIGGGQFVEVGPSNEATGMAVNHPPANPVNLIGSSLGNTVTLDWEPNTDYDINQYRIFRRDYNANDFVLAGTVVHPDTTFSEVLSVDGIYRYKVAAVDAEDMQSAGFSNNVDVAIGAIPPRQLSATTDIEFRIDLNWRHPGSRPLVPNMNVMVIAADDASQFIQELLTFDDIDTIIYFDARLGTPTLQELEEISVAIVWSNNPFNDPVAMGNVLADFVDDGGGVLIQQFSFGSGWDLQGRLMSEYSPFSAGTISYSDKSLGNFDPNSPIMDGVTAITEYFASAVSIINNGTWVASYNDDTPFVAHSPDVNVAAINGYVGDSRQFTGDMIIMVHNAMNFVAGGVEIIPDNYKIYKGDNPGGPFTFHIELPGDVRNYTDEPVPNGVDYYYYVTAVYAGPEESDPSNVAIGAGMNYPPMPPYDLVGVVDDRDIEMDWSFDDTMGDLDHFNVYKKLLPDGNFVLDGTTFDTSYVITIPGGEDGVYAVAAAAVDDGNPALESAYSNQVFAPVGNLPPANLRATSNQESVVPLAWSEPGLRPTTTLTYDDGVLANGYYYFAFDAIIANRFVGSTPVQVETLWVHVLTEGDEYWPWPDPTHDPVGISLWDDDGTGMPGNMEYYVETTCTPGEWIMVPIEGGVTLSGPNFWVGMQNLDGGGEDGMGLGANTDYPQHKWARTDGNWNQQDTYSGDQMIRVTIIDNTTGLALNLTESEPTIDLAREAKKSGKTPQFDMTPGRSLLNEFSDGGDIPLPMDIEIILGYNIYRSDTPNVPVDSTHKINDSYITEMTYDDSSVVNGNTYYYVATAIYDNSGNIEESPASNEVDATPMLGAGMVLDPLSFDVNAQQGEIVTELLNISNPGGLDLDFAIETFADNIMVNPSDPPTWTFEARFTSFSEEFDKSVQTPEPTFPPIILDSGGPDDWGYTWIDSDEPNGPTYDWIDIVGIGQQLFMSDDDNQGPFALPFSFPFYDLTFNSFRVCSNGFISFTSTSTDYSNDPILDPNSPENLVAPFWDDFNPAQGGEIWVYTDSNMAVVSWINVPHFSSGGPYTVQAVLHSDGSIIYNYANMGSPVNSATIGIQNSNLTIGLQIAYNQAYVHNDLAVLIKAGWLSADPRAGTVAPGDNQNVTITFDAGTLDIGTYTGSIVVTGYDMNHQVDQITVPVTFNVGITGIVDAVAALPREFILHQNFPNPFNPTTEIKFDLPANSYVRLEIFNVLGQKVKTVIDAEMEAGFRSVTWDGSDDRGNDVASGVYFYKLNAGEHVFTKKMTMLK